MYTKATPKAGQNGRMWLYAGFCPFILPTAGTRSYATAPKCRPGCGLSLEKPTFGTSDYECSPTGPDARMRLAPPPMDFFDCSLRGTSTHRPGPHHGPSSATELSSRREDVLATSRPAVHGICDRRGRFDRRMHNKLTRDDVHCAACRDRPKLRARSHELRRGGPIIMWTSAAPDIKSNRDVLGHL